MTNEGTRELLHRYYDCWKSGPSSYDEAALRGLLAADLAFESPIGKKRGQDAFLRGLVGFAGSIKSHRVLKEFYSGGDAAVFYDCELSAPAGTLSLGELFRCEDGKIQEIKLVFDATEVWKVLAQRAQTATG